MLAGVGVGLCDPSSAARMLNVASRIAPKMAAEEREAHLARWNDAIARAKSAAAAHPAARAAARE